MIYYIYDASGNVIGLKYNNDIYYYEKNIQNDITGIIDDSFNLLATYEYDSWGNILSIKDTNGNTITDSSNIALINPFRYRSYYYDSEIGMYYLNSRYYNQEWGRFINADNISATANITNMYNKNLYSYTDNNPISRVDNQGEYWIVVLMLVGGLASFTINGIANLANGEDFLSGSAVAFVAGMTGIYAGSLFTSTAVSIVIGSYTASLVESGSTEAIAYGNSSKELNIVNLKQSAISVGKSTLTNGTISVITAGVAYGLYPTKSYWFEPQKLNTMLTGKTATKIYMQTLNDAALQTSYKISSIVSNKNSSSKYCSMNPIPALPKLKKQWN